MKLQNNLILLKNKYSLLFEDFHFRCSIGENGKTSKKIEGDKKTPKGTYKLGNLFYRKERVQKPLTKLGINTIKPEMGWCNDIKDKKNYNELVSINKIKKSEKLFRNDDKYNYLIPILYNTKNKILGKGSAIFIHLTKDYKKTAGCIALTKKDFLIILKLINKKTKIKIC
tara:strand:+ start:237 stop:746 length:510 start_codon:yes stop_codon:yes gene_type:complete